MIMGKGRWGSGNLHMIMAPGAGPGPGACEASADLRTYIGISTVAAGGGRS